MLVYKESAERLICKTCSAGAYNPLLLIENVNASSDGQILSTDLILESQRATE